ncbi:MULTISPECIES: hypothetical protein, partial [unclassified Rhizobium]
MLAVATSAAFFIAAELAESVSRRLELSSRPVMGAANRPAVMVEFSAAAGIFGAPFRDGALCAFHTPTVQLAILPVWERFWLLDSGYFWWILWVVLVVYEISHINQLV